MRGESEVDGEGQQGDSLTSEPLMKVLTNNSSVTAMRVMYWRMRWKRMYLEVL